MREIFHYPRLSNHDFGLVRSPGPGLGNLLFPISRALIAAEATGGTFVYPTLRQVKIGTFLRREKDGRTYGRLFRRRTRQDWRTWRAAMRRPWVSERQPDGAVPGVTVVYEGLGRYFHELVGHRQLLADWLERNAAQPVDPQPFDIALHVRLGDFGEARNPSQSGGNNVRQSLEWYRNAYDQAVGMAGSGKPSAVLFTDGDADSVIEGLAIEGLRAAGGANALETMMTMARARVLVASRSTFSMWAAFLGGMPAIWDKDYRTRTDCFPDRPDLDVLA